MSILAAITLGEPSRFPNGAADQRLSGLIKPPWLESGGVYGYSKITEDLRDLGERCGKYRVYRLKRAEGLRSQTALPRCKVRYGKPAVVAPNRLGQQFDVQVPNQVWVTDNTYIRPRDGWLYLAVVLDLFWRQVVGWSMQSRMETDLALNALLMAHLAPAAQIGGDHPFRSG